MKRQKINFTKKVIEDLEVPAKRTYYRDLQVRGLSLEVSPSGMKSFYARRMIGGRHDKLCVGRFPDISVEQARAKAISFQADLSAGHSQAEEKRQLNAELTLSELFELYLERHMFKLRRSGPAMRKCFDNWLLHWKDWKLSSITREPVEVLHARLAKERGKYAANRCLQLISAMYNKAILWKLFKGDNPARGITKFAEFSRERVLREDEIGAFFSALDQEPRDQFYDVIMLLILTGQRKSNVLAMRWQDIDFTAKTWSVPGELMKNGQTLTIALTEKEITILQRRLGKKVNDFVFYSPGKRGHYIEPKRRWKELLARAEINDFHIHDLRRTLASYMANSGANVALIVLGST